MPTAKVLTFGCKVNQFESRAIIQVLEEAGYDLVEKGSGADLVVINTCTVTHRADREARSMVRQAKRANPAAKVVMAGCWAQARPEELIKLPGVSMILGQEFKFELLDFLPEIKPDADRPLVKVSSLSSKMTLSSLGFPEFTRTRAFFRVQDGCSAACAYCAIPSARGPSRSLDPDQVFEGLKSYGESGYKELVLTGIHLSAWGRELEPAYDFMWLLKKISTEAFNFRIRISSIEPEDVSEELIKLVADSELFCPHLHLPLQSGDAGVLSKMRRPYSPVYFEEMVNQVADSWPGAGLGADVMAGFPGEDDAAFQNTVDLIKRLPLTYLHVFPFSKRPGTLAAKMPNQVGPDEIKKRAAVLRQLDNEKRQAFYQSQTGLTRPTIIENTKDAKTGAYRGLTDNYIRVHLDEDSDTETGLKTVKLTGPGSGKFMLAQSIGR